MFLFYVLSFFQKRGHYSREVLIKEVYGNSYDNYFWHASYCEHLWAHPNWLWTPWYAPRAWDTSEGWQGKGSDIQKSLGPTKAIELTETAKRHSLIRINLKTIFQSVCLKVSYFRNVFLVSSILPKNERKQFDLR